MLVTAQSVVRLVNEAFCRLMQRLSDDKLSLLTEEMLALRTQEHGLPHEATRDFLVARGVLRLLGNANERLSWVRIASSDEQWRNMLRDNIRGVRATASACVTQQLADGETQEGYQLWVLLQPRYSEAAIAAFYEQLVQVPTASGLVAISVRARCACHRSTARAMARRATSATSDGKRAAKPIPVRAPAPCSRSCGPSRAWEPQSFPLHRFVIWTGQSPAPSSRVASSSWPEWTPRNCCRKKSPCGMSSTCRRSPTHGMWPRIGQAVTANTEMATNHDTGRPPTIR